MASTQQPTAPDLALARRLLFRATLLVFIPILLGGLLRLTDNAPHSAHSPIQWVWMALWGSSLFSVAVAVHFLGRVRKHGDFAAKLASVLLIFPTVLLGLVALVSFFVLSQEMLY